MLQDNYQTRLKVMFVLILLLYAVLAFGQRYRVRAVNDLFYIPDTIAQADNIAVYSPYLDSIEFVLLKPDSTEVATFTRTYQSLPAASVQPGSYRWELTYKIDSSFVRRRGVMVIK
jgi:hypothetical protein